MREATSDSTARGALLPLLLGMILVVPLLWLGSGGSSHWKAAAFGLFGVGLGAIWLLRLDWEAGIVGALAQVRSGPNLPLALLLGWTGLAAMIAPMPAYAWEAWLRFACGAVIYVVVAYYVRQQEQVQAMLRATVAVAILAVAAGLALSGGAALTGLAGTFYDRQLFGAFLLLLMPVVLGTAMGTRRRRWGVGARVTAVILLACLAITRCWSAWLGAAVSLTVFALLTVGSAPTQRPSRWSMSRRRSVVVAVAVAAVVMVLVTGGELLRSVGGAISRGIEDSSGVDRVALWSSAFQMMLARPLLGFGLGAFPFYLADFLPTARPTAIVQAHGPSLSENAHNFYLQLGAEAGFPALVFYLAMLITFFVTALRALPQLAPGLRRAVLIGTIAAMAGHAVDALANPAWVFAECSLFLWVVMGLGMAAAGLANHTAPEAVTHPVRPSGLPIFLARGLRTAFVGCLTLWMSARVCDVTLIQAAVANHIYANEVQVDTIGFDYLDDSVPPPAAFQVDRATVVFGVQRQVDFKIYVVHPDGGSTNVTGEPESRLQVTHNGHGMLQRGESPDGGPAYVYTPSIHDVGRVVTLFAKLRIGEKAYGSFFMLRVAEPYR